MGRGRTQRKAPDSAGVPRAAASVLCRVTFQSFHKEEGTILLVFLVSALRQNSEDTFPDSKCLKESIARTQLLK